MMTLTQIANTKLFAFIAVLVLTLIWGAGGRVKLRNGKSCNVGMRETSVPNLVSLTRPGLQYWAKLRPGYF